MLLPPLVSTALLQLLHIGLIVSFGFPCSFASYPKYFQIALLLCSLSTKAGCGGAALTIFIFTSLLLFNQSEWDETRDRHCGHVWCLSTRLWREVKVTARLGSEYRYFGKLVLVPFRYFSIDIYRNIDIFDNTSAEWIRWSKSIYLSVIASCYLSMGSFCHGCGHDQVCNAMISELFSQ